MQATDYLLSRWIKSYLESIPYSDDYYMYLTFIHERHASLIDRGKCTMRDTLAINAAVLRKEPFHRKIGYSATVIQATFVNLIAALLKKDFVYK